MKKWMWIFLFSGLFLVSFSSSYCSEEPSDGDNLVTVTRVSTEGDSYDFCFEHPIDWEKVNLSISYSDITMKKIGENKFCSLFFLYDEDGMGEGEYRNVFGGGAYQLSEEIKGYAFPNKDITGGSMSSSAKSMYLYREFKNVMLPNGLGKGFGAVLIYSIDIHHVIGMALLEANAETLRDDCNALLKQIYITKQKN
jgi:hypothetical protein